MKNNKKKIIIGGIILAVLIAIFTVCYFKFYAKPVEGSKKVVIEVVDREGNTTGYKLATDAEFLKQAMDELSKSDKEFSYKGSESEYGIMIEEINGQQAIYDKDNAYWALYVNDNYGEYGADQQPVIDGETYTWKYESVTQ
ncbi:MAG: DUF4430 domain-containing protein [Pseudobutyrivibrio sp.]|nr:DUF4430 domain-containing protein [Pseudobutyrivibrio sp.]